MLTLIATQRTIAFNDLMAVAVETLERFAQYKCIIEDCASRWLAELDSDVGRLVYVSMLRDVSSARYYHPALEAIYSPSAVHQALLYCHEELFEKVLGHSLELLEGDLRMYFAGIDAPPDEIAARRSFLSPHPFSLQHGCSTETNRRRARYPADSSLAIFTGPRELASLFDRALDAFAG